MFYRIETLHQSDGSNDSESYDYYSTITDALSNHTPGVHDESYPGGYYTYTCVSDPEPCDVIEPHYCGETYIHIPGVLHTCAEPERAPERRSRPVW